MPEEFVTLLVRLAWVALAQATSGFLGAIDGRLEVFSNGRLGKVMEHPTIGPIVGTVMIVQAQIFTEVV